ncbi:hypothetical protein SSP35_01_02880 [Streptomyces sp. NBRC 110611]|uniref:hypothetical protein n=1 Tax=Streptomyces sp. NBRC 110611 TaxID=1621259 RepID=UPI0008358B91|nr:hypothetical protein [Streptomyces sp. NBRC 110611]GAU64951.1 hypothetical protein SSP35_01_02880 [Streptomyces sp. NBRC 110611]
MPDDYFGRLLARYAPERSGPPSAGPSTDPFPAASDGRTGGTGGRTAGVARRALVRPRLPGPFERVEALRGASGELDVPDASASPSPRSAWSPSPPFDGEPIRYEREIRTVERERRTTAAPGAAPRQGPTGRDGRAARPAASLLRPAAAAEPGPRPAAPEAVRPARRAGTGAADGGPGAGARASVSARAQADTGLLTAAPAPRPGADDGPAAARNAAARAASSGRRGQRAAERVVHVQIGRLEVSAARTEGPPGSGRPVRTERRAPSLSLADYLARGEGTGR